MTDKTEGTYGSTSRLNHWIGAILFASLLIVGFILSYDLLPDEQAGEVRNLHKATGTLMLLFAIWRVTWRIGQGFPAPASDRAGWELTLSKAVHGAMLLTLIVMPLSGVLMSLLGGRPIDMYGLFTIPPVAEMKDLARSFRAVHGYAAWTLAILIGLHIAGALKHSVIDKDSTLRRMLTGKTAEA
ncbi:MAG: cytochrome b [Hyphomonas sp.]|jgi:cytochrome b561|nr:cytochrome b [Hyphomonas sp.]